MSSMSIHEAKAQVSGLRASGERLAGGVLRAPRRRWYCLSAPESVRVETTDSGTEFEDFAPCGPLSRRANTLIHGDPFDRMLVAQALVEGLPIVSSNRRLSAYGVAVIW